MTCRSHPWTYPTEDGHSSHDHGAFVAPPWQHLESTKCRRFSLSNYSSNVAEQLQFADSRPPILTFAGGGNLKNDHADAAVFSLEVVKFRNLYSSRSDILPPLRRLTTETARSLAASGLFRPGER